MGIIVNKDNTNKNELSRRIDADLKAKQLETAEIEGEPDPDFAEDSEYVKHMTKTGKFSWMWFVLIVLAIAAIILIAFI